MKEEATEKEVIYLQQSYVNSKGVIVHALIEVVDDSPAAVLERKMDGTQAERKFMAMGQSMVPLAGMPSPCPIQFQFQIPGASIEEAFANLPDAFKKAEGEAQIQARSDHRKQQLANIMQ